MQIKLFVLVGVLALPVTALAQVHADGHPPLPTPGGGLITESTSGIREFDLPDDEGRSTTQQVLSEMHPHGRLWYQHVQTLANPWFEGRQPGTRGDELALTYIQWHMDRIGLEPGFPVEDAAMAKGHDNPWRQPFTFSLGRALELSFQGMTVGRRHLSGGEDFNTLANSGTGRVKAPLTFVGYGIEEGPDGYTSYEDAADLTGRIAVLLRYEPLNEDGMSQWAEEGFSSHSGVRSKFAGAIDRGAEGVILVTPPSCAEGTHDLESVDSTRGFGRQLDVPVVHMTAEAANDMLRQAGQSLDMLVAGANSGELTTKDLSSLTQVSIDTQLERKRISTHNIGGVLPGSGDLADDWIIIGGHYDHIGHGYVGSRAPGSDEIHPGADDNASGTASVLVLAERLHEWAQDHEGDRRSIMFMGFGGEEAGLHGSRWFVNNPTMDTDRVSMMVNLDMVGRLRNDTVMLSGVGTAEEFDAMLPSHVEPSGLLVQASRGGTGPSDHSSFFSGGMPVLFFFTGLHDDYHRPEDEAWAIDPEGGIRIVGLAESVTKDVATRENNLTFVQSTAAGPARRTGAKVRLGIMPSYSADLETGVLVDSVTPGTSAADGGLKKGDVMLKWNDTVLEGGSDLMAALRKHDPGDTVSVTVNRGGKPVELQVKLKGRSE